LNVPAVGHGLRIIGPNFRNSTRAIVFYVKIFAPPGLKATFPTFVPRHPLLLSFRQSMKTLNPKAEYVVKNGKATAVILPIAEYEELLEDLHDLAVIARRKDEPTIPLDEVKRRLKRHASVSR
jgi:PHD/YefM family antitoxin component YafN of YafNO toxin-antitoxin module